jgi:dihydroorotase
MKLLIQGGRVINPATQFDAVADVAVAAGRIVAIGQAPADFDPQRVIDARGLVVAPGLVDLSVRLGEPGNEHARMLESELAASVAGGVTSVVCPPDTDPVLDEPGLVEMLKSRAEKMHQSRVFPLGALTRQLQGDTLTEMGALTQAGCVGFTQAEVTLANTQVLRRAFQYASTFGYSVWLRPVDHYLGQGVAASGALATRLGLSGVPVAAETIALFTMFETLKSTGTRVHICRLSSAAGVAMVRQAKAEGLPVTCDVSINSLLLTDTDVGYFDSRMRVNPPLRQQADREALQQGLADGTIDALVSDHTPVKDDAKALPFAQSEPGATGVELLLGMALKWADQRQLPLSRALQVITQAPAAVLGASLGTLASSLGQLHVGGVADVCVFDPAQSWQLQASQLHSQGHHTPFDGHVMPAQVRYTLVGGHLAYQA